MGILVWFLLLALCSYGLYWAWTQYRSYELRASSAARAVLPFRPL